MTVDYLPRRGMIFGVAVLIVGLVVIGSAPAVASETSPSHAGNMHEAGGHMQGQFGPFLWWMPFVMPVLWLGLLAGVVYLVYRFITRDTSTDSARQALDRTYARGEISTEEYERRRARLEA